MTTFQAIASSVPPCNNLLQVTARTPARRKIQAMESATPIKPVAPENEEATEAWSGVLYDRFVQFRQQIVLGLAKFGTEALRLHPPHEGNRVLDIGCGFG